MRVEKTHQVQAHKQLKIDEDETALNQIILINAEDIVTVADAITTGQIINIVIDHYQVQSQIGRQKTDEKDTGALRTISTIDGEISNTLIPGTNKNLSREMYSKNLRLK